MSKIPLEKADSTIPAAGSEPVLPSEEVQIPESLKAQSLKFDQIVNAIAPKPDEGLKTMSIIENEGLKDPELEIHRYLSTTDDTDVADLREMDAILDPVARDERIE
ncbi:hypothetical protein EMCG_06932 [[Emmonsia] crescens]|uniref:Uncharacterized protein n=1 Tax=[Emmonsia] crescens TaxID=73230 RepID=A0A0G2J689_9EURO|nr:hypothetical protein EMCG_06932 [Emmonsia crescens UAMH 3008]